MFFCTLLLEMLPVGRPTTSQIQTPSLLHTAELRLCYSNPHLDAHLQPGHHGQESWLGHQDEWKEVEKLRQGCGGLAIGVMALRMGGGMRYAVAHC